MLTQRCAEQSHPPYPLANCEGGNTPSRSPGHWQLFPLTQNTSQTPWSRNYLRGLQTSTALTLMHRSHQYFTTCEERAWVSNQSLQHTHKGLNTEYFVITVLLDFLFWNSRNKPMHQGFLFRKSHIPPLLLEPECHDSLLLFHIPTASRLAILRYSSENCEDMGFCSGFQCWSLTSLLQTSSNSAVICLTSASTHTKS